jgi:hypothetical protein
VDGTSADDSFGAWAIIGNAAVGSRPHSLAELRVQMVASGPRKGFRYAACFGRNDGKRSNVMRRIAS